MDSQAENQEMEVAGIKSRLARAVQSLSGLLASPAGSCIAACGSGGGTISEASAGDAGGALIQVWMPRRSPDGSTNLSSQVRVVVVWEHACCGARREKWDASSGGDRDPARASPHALSGRLLRSCAPRPCTNTAPRVLTTLQGLPFAVAGVGDLLALFRCVSCRFQFSTDASKPSLMGAIGRVYTSCQVRVQSFWPGQPSSSIRSRCRDLCMHHAPRMQCRSSMRPRTNPPSLPMHAPRVLHPPSPR
jgi:hypothetical protein